MDKQSCREMTRNIIILNNWSQNVNNYTPWQRHRGKLRAKLESRRRVRFDEDSALMKVSPHVVLLSTIIIVLIIIRRKYYILAADSFPTGPGLLHSTPPSAVFSLHNLNPMLGGESPMKRTGMGGYNNGLWTQGVKETRFVGTWNNHQNHPNSSFISLLFYSHDGHRRITLFYSPPWLAEHT